MGGVICRGQKASRTDEPPAATLLGRLKAHMVFCLHRLESLHKGPPRKELVGQRARTVPMGCGRKSPHCFRRKQAHSGLCAHQQGPPVGPPAPGRRGGLNRETTEQQDPVLTPWPGASGLSLPRRLRNKQQLSPLFPQMDRP